MRGRRVSALGKHLRCNGAPFRVRGATYGTFVPRADGARFPHHAEVRADFEAMAAAGFNTVRTYTVPPPDVLDLAAEHGLKLLVGLDHHDWRMEPVPGRAAGRRILDSGRAAAAAAMTQLAERPEVLAVVVGNEVPGDIVRVHGIRSVERTLSALVAEVHAADPDMLACYVNYPTTEYLEVDGQDLMCFNVFLERPDALRRYLRHLQRTAGDRPLVVTELGLAAEVHGEEAQAASLRSQLRLVDECGLAGATIFSWTDEWNVGGADVEGWGFGITDTGRRPKPALEAASGWARSTLRDARATWPRISVVVCAYNAAATIGECLDSLVGSDYPNLEVIVCDDGSTDGTPELARHYPVQLLELSHAGLATARNRGIAASTGDIVAFLDSDAACHAEWPYYLALSLEDENVVGAGGPNLPFPDAGFVERAVAESPGGPVEVLVSDDRAEHVPGCNMAFRKDALDEIGCFDPVYTAAGDDVDVCWKLLDRGYEIAFSPAAQVLHHRRGTVRGYLRQQVGYGKAERLMASRHKHRFNRLGQARWAGFIYGRPNLLSKFLRPVVYHGSMGTAPFQPVVGRRSDATVAWVGACLPLLLPLLLVGALAPLDSRWLAAPAAALFALLAYAVAVAVRPPRGEVRPLRFRFLVAAMHVAQPFARLWGRLRGRAPEPTPRSEPQAWLGERTVWLNVLAQDLAARGCRAQPSEAHEPWDLSVRRSPFVTARVTTAVHWRWLPSYRVTVRPRPALLLGMGAAASFAALGAWYAIVVGSGMAFAVAGDTALLVHTARESLRRTTQGASARSVEARTAQDLEAALRLRLVRDAAGETAYVRESL